MVKEYFIAFEPEEELVGQILKQKEFVRDSIGEQKYLSDPPHFTLYLFSCDNIDEVISKLNGVVNNLKRFSVSLTGFHVFYDDIVTGGHTITYGLDDSSVRILRGIQIKVINSIKEFNTNVRFSNSSSSYGKMPNLQKANCDLFGFPYVGDIWVPHITVASIDKLYFDNLFSKLKSQPINGSYLLDSINIYEITDNNKRVAHFRLIE